jgi:chaperonin GroEL
VRKALSAPACQIAINAGEDGSVIVGKILEKDQYAYGFDSQTGEYGNLVVKGIIDPTKVGSDNQLGDFRFSHEFQTSR